MASRSRFGGAEGASLDWLWNAGNRVLTSADHEEIGCFGGVQQSFGGMPAADVRADLGEAGLADGFVNDFAQRRVGCGRAVPHCSRAPLWGLERCGNRLMSCAGRVHSQVSTASRSRMEITPTTIRPCFTGR